MAEPDSAEGPFSAGDHLRVRRNALYSHHGIYLGDDRVVEFGGDWRNKQDAAIRETSLTAFQDGGRAEVVRHDEPPLLARWMPTSVPVDERIERALFLLRTAEPGRYNLAGHNCEHAATWCATGFPESHQVRVALYANLVRSTATMWFIAYLVGRKRRVPTWAWVSTVIAFLITVQYHWHQRRFVLEIDRAWRAYKAQQHGP